MTKSAPETTKTILRWIWNRIDDGIYFSQEWLEYTGLVVGSTDDWLLSVHPDDRGRVVEAHRESTEGDVSICLKYRIKAKDALQYAWAYELINPVKKDGRHIATMGEAEVQACIEQAT